MTIGKMTFFNEYIFSRPVDTQTVFVFSRLDGNTIIIHIYEGTAAMPGTFHGMTNGTVTEKWAWTHHPAWYRAVTGRDPRAAYERERRRQAERERAIENLEREQDARERLADEHVLQNREP